MDSSVLCLPGIFQFRRMACCLACGLKDLRMSPTFIWAIIHNKFTVEDVCNSFELLESFPKEKRKAIQAICRSIMDYHNGNLAPVVHRRYYQKDVLDIKHEELLFKIKRGYVLEIFQKDWNSFVAGNVIENLKDDFMEIVQPDGVYPYLPKVKFDKFVCVSTAENLISLSTRNASCSRTRLFVQDWTDSPLDVIFFRIKWLIPKFSRISMVIINQLYTKGQALPCVNQWLVMLTQVFGCLDDVIIVFQIVYTDFSKFDLVMKADVRKAINKNVSKKMREKILYLDVSPVSERIHEDGAVRTLEVLPLD